MYVTYPFRLTLELNFPCFPPKTLKYLSRYSFGCRNRRYAFSKAISVLDGRVIRDRTIGAVTESDHCKICEIFTRLYCVEQSSLQFVDRCLAGVCLHVQLPRPCHVEIQHVFPIESGPDDTKQTRHAAAISKHIHFDVRIVHSPLLLSEHMNSAAACALWTSWKSRPRVLCLIGGSGWPMRGSKRKY
jgi:hypothetical protein